MDIGDRIRVAREAAAISKSELARRIGVHPSACIQWESQEGTYPKLEHLIQLAIIFDVRFEWLATGRGEMQYSAAARDERPSYGTPELRLKSDEQRLLSIYRGLPPRRRKSFFELLDALAGEGKKSR